METIHAEQKRVTDLEQILRIVSKATFRKQIENNVHLLVSKCFQLDISFANVAPVHISVEKMSKPSPPWIMFFAAPTFMHQNQTVQNILLSHGLLDHMAQCIVNSCHSGCCACGKLLKGHGFELQRSKRLSQQSPQ